MWTLLQARSTPAAGVEADNNAQIVVWQTVGCRQEGSILHSETGRGITESGRVGLVAQEIEWSNGWLRLHNAIVRTQRRIHV